jgi:hypothetical protein
MDRGDVNKLYVLVDAGLESPGSLDELSQLVSNDKWKDKENASEALQTIKKAIDESTKQNGYLELASLRNRAHALVRQENLVARTAGQVLEWAISNRQAVKSREH